MSNVVSLFKGQVGLNNHALSVIESILQTHLEKIVRDELRPYRETLLALNAQVSDISTRVIGIDSKLHEMKHTDFLGKRDTILPEAAKEASSLSGEEVRKLINSAARKFPGGKRNGHNVLYARVSEISGFDIFAEGPTRLGKKDKIDGWRKDPSYINTILKHGLKEYAVVVAKDMLKGK